MKWIAFYSGWYQWGGSVEASVTISFNDMTIDGLNAVVWGFINLLIGLAKFKDVTFWFDS